MKKSLFVLMFISISLIICCTNKGNKEVQINEIDIILKKVAEESNKLYPMQLDKNTKIISTASIGNKTLCYKLEIPNKPTVEEINFQTEKIKNSYRTNPNYEIFRDYKVNIVYSYSNPVGEFLFDIKFNSGEL